MFNGIRIFNDEDDYCHFGPTSIKKPWSQYEDDALRQLVEVHGTNSWTQVAELLVERSGKQCRERWHNHLNPGIKKGSWTPEEDQIIITMQKVLGNQWAMITKMLPARTDNAVKNRFHATERARVRAELAERKSPNTLPNHHYQNHHGHYMNNGVLMGGGMQSQQHQQGQYVNGSNSGGINMNGGMNRSAGVNSINASKHLLPAPLVPSFYANNTDVNDNSSSSTAAATSSSSSYIPSNNNNNNKQQQHPNKLNNNSSSLSENDIDNIYTPSSQHQHQQHATQRALIESSADCSTTSSVDTYDNYSHDEKEGSSGAGEKIKSRDLDQVLQAVRKIIETDRTVGSGGNNVIITPNMPISNTSISSSSSSSSPLSIIQDSNDDSNSKVILPASNSTIPSASIGSKDFIMSPNMNIPSSSFQQQSSSSSSPYIPAQPNPYFNIPGATTLSTTITSSATMQRSKYRHSTGSSTSSSSRYHCHTQQQPNSSSSSSLQYNRAYSRPTTAASYSPETIKAIQDSLTAYQRKNTTNDNNTADNEGSGSLSIPTAVATSTNTTSSSSLPKMKSSSSGIFIPPLPLSSSLLSSSSPSASTHHNNNNNNAVGTIDPNTSTTGVMGYENKKKLRFVPIIDGFPSPRAYPEEAQPGKKKAVSNSSKSLMLNSQMNTMNNAMNSNSSNNNEGVENQYDYYHQQQQQQVRQQVVIQEKDSKFLHRNKFTRQQLQLPLSSLSSNNNHNNNYNHSNDNIAANYGSNNNSNCSNNINNNINTAVSIDDDFENLLNDIAMMITPRLEGISISPRLEMLSPRLAAALANTTTGGTALQSFAISSAGKLLAAAAAAQHHNNSSNSSSHSSTGSGSISSGGNTSAIGRSLSRSTSSEIHARNTNANSVNSNHASGNSVTFSASTENLTSATAGNTGTTDVIIDAIVDNISDGIIIPELPTTTVVTLSSSPPVPSSLTTTSPNNTTVDTNTSKTATSGGSGFIIPISARPPFNQSLSQDSNNSKNNNNNNNNNNYNNMNTSRSAYSLNLSLYDGDISDWLNEYDSEGGLLLSTSAKGGSGSMKLGSPTATTANASSLNQHR